jgi:hypothetical protein
MAVSCFVWIFQIQTMDGRLGAAAARAQTTYRMQKSVIGAAGSGGSSTNYRMNGTLGQSTPIGIGATFDAELQAGFWARVWIPTGIEETPAAYRTLLFQNYPNPFNPLTTVEYSLANAGRVEIAVFDVGGRRIATLVDAQKAPGRYRAIWDGKNESGRQVASGIYFCRMRADSKTIINKMILLR